VRPSVANAATGAGLLFALAAGSPAHSANARVPAAPIVRAQDARRGAAIAARVLSLTRDAVWRRVAALPLRFRTFHPQGLARVGESWFVSSVEVSVPTRTIETPGSAFDRDTGSGVAHLFQVDDRGGLVADLKLGEGSVYHPGGIDFDGAYLWVPVAEYRPGGRSIVYRVDPATLRAEEVLRVADHIGAIVHDTDAGTLHGVSWGSRRFYRWRLDDSGRAIAASSGTAPESTPNPSHYVDYQDCKYLAAGRMLCTGVSEIRQGGSAPPFRLGGLELIDLRESRPLHQVPVLAWTDGGLDVTHNPSWFEATASGLRAFFLPEDDRSTLYTYEVDPR
jgi:hypothetical protein